MPRVDRRVVLDARVGALPGRLRDVLEERRALDRADDGAVGSSGQVPLLTLDDRLHEGVRDANRVVRVLVLDRAPVGRVERHVVSRLLEDACLALLLRLAPDELVDVGMIDVEYDHLRRAARLAARLDRARRGVRAAHERDRAGRVAALRELLLRGAQAREVDPRARAAAEDHALAADPVEDRVHRVVDREDETRRALWLLLEPDVEPHGRVERCDLVDEDRLQLRLERLGLLVGREVAALAAPAADRVDDSADHLLHGALTLGRGHAAAEVLLRDDVRGRLRPEAGELDVLLLECRAILAGDQRVARLPLDLVERVAAGDREEPLRGDACALIDDRVDVVVRCAAERCGVAAAVVAFVVAMPASRPSVDRKRCPPSRVRRWEGFGMLGGGSDGAHDRCSRGRIAIFAQFAGK